jgi:hypothetical protein
VLNNAEHSLPSIDLEAAIELNEFNQSSDSIDSHSWNNPFYLPLESSPAGRPTIKLVPAYLPKICNIDTCLQTAELCPIEEVLKVHVDDIYMPIFLPMNEKNIEEIAHLNEEDENLEWCSRNSQTL